MSRLNDCLRALGWQGGTIHQVKDIVEAWKDYKADHYKHFEGFPIDFEFDSKVYSGEAMDLVDALYGGGL